MTCLAQTFLTTEHVRQPRLHSKSDFVPVRHSIFGMVVAISLMGCQSTSYQDATQHSYHTEQANEIAFIRTQMAAQYLVLNELDNAKLQLEKALSANKRYAPAYDMMGVLLQAEGSRLNIIEAESYFRQALVLQPQLMKARNNYGVYLSQLGRYDEAMHQFEIAGAALGYEGRIKALENLGLTALKRGDYALATETFVRVLERDRNNLVAHLELIDLLIINNQLAQAENLYNEMLMLVEESAITAPRIIQQRAKLRL